MNEGDGNNSKNTFTIKMDSHDVYIEEDKAIDITNLETEKFYNPDCENSSSHYADTTSTETPTEQKPPGIDTPDRNLNIYHFATRAIYNTVMTP